MKNLKIYNTRQARKDLRAKNINGLEASIKKWESLFSIILKLRNEALSPCGLCLTRDLCKSCPAENCGDRIVMKRVMGNLKNTQHAMKDLIDFLKELR